jgi:cellulose synthase/poly-beta-1,6-N-acetylglucosamine synthase-like glycosyltransferase
MWVVLFLYCFSLLILFLFSMGQLHLTWHYLKRLRKQQHENKAPILTELPAVTVQLPLYNERYVAERLLDSVAHLDYPKDKLHIQVLDDSTDETVELVAQKVQVLQSEGIQIEHTRRPERTGFKAGALQYGLASASEFITIFDADFLPKPDFLLKTIPFFQQENIGVVQTRWGHINRDYNRLTKLQAFGLDAHFTVEQGGRSEAGSYINFNGTAGVWRKRCIEDAGGWSADTLTEDLDLSYRAQMLGWKFEFREEVESPAELPVLMPAIRSQHFRWNKGAAECARKNLLKAMRKSEGFGNKMHAFFHLTNSSIFGIILLAALLSVPVLFMMIDQPQLKTFFHLGVVFLFGFLAIAIFYYTASKRIYPHKYARYFWRLFPQFLVVSMGLSAHNTLAILEGWLGKKSAFLRTPKFNIQTKTDNWKGNVYLSNKVNSMLILEAGLLLYFLFGLGAGIYLNEWGLIPFHTMLVLGFGSVIFYSLKGSRV